jgi:hypothetical protein
MKRCAVLAAILARLGLTHAAHAKTVVFWQDDFPAIETEAPPRAALQHALIVQHPVFLSLAELEAPGALAPGDLLVLPYGSAFPADAWDLIRQHLSRGNLLNIGGRPLTVPVRRGGAEWRVGPPQATWSHVLNIDHTVELSLPTNARPTIPLQARRVFAIAADNDHGNRRGFAFLLDAAGDRIAAPVVADDFPNSRRVYLNFDPAPGFWASSDGEALLRDTAQYAARGPVKLFLDLDSLTLDPGGVPSGVIDLQRSGPPATLRIELLSGSRVLSTVPIEAAASLHRPFRFAAALEKPGLYEIRAELIEGGRSIERYETGVWVRDRQLLASGAKLSAGRDFLRLDNQPYLAVGANYFSTDPYASFFLGDSLGGNPWLWDRDFAEMERHGITFVRTGVWKNRSRYLDPTTGGASERFLSALEAFLHSAARHHMQVNFTFFAFTPDSGVEPTSAKTASPYTDPAAIESQLAWVRSIVARFHSVPFLSYDLINEPNFSDPSKLWRGNVPNPDPTELAAWREWLANRYLSPEALAEAWRVPLPELGGFSNQPLPDLADLSPQRSGNSRLARAVDFNLFAQDTFRQWAAGMIRGVREAGSTQAVTIGQDEGGVADRVLNQFYGDLDIAFTVNHTWWRDDALLWDSLAAKRPDKPNLVGETGVQPAWAMDGSWRWDETTALRLIERKLALGFAAANAGAVYWDWARGDTFGLMRRDGSFKPALAVLSGIAGFARQAQPFAREAERPEIAIVLPQSAQLSAWNALALEAQQKCVRALYYYARQSAYTVGEYQLSLLGDPKLIVVPAPFAFRQDAWETLMSKVRAGATLLISGRVDADEHFRSVPSRTAGWAPGYRFAPLTARENVLNFPGSNVPLSYSGEKTTYAERGVLPVGDYLETRVGQGRILYSALPLELADQLDSIGRIYRYAAGIAGVSPAYKTEITDPGILICPTRLPDATLYVVLSESSASETVAFEDEASHKQIQAKLDPGRAALFLITHSGDIAASYPAGAVPE